MAKGWYVIHTYSGYENKVKTSLEEQLVRAGLKEEVEIATEAEPDDEGEVEPQQKIDQVVIPTEEVIEIRQGKKKVTSRKFFPGYILINIDMNEDVWYMIKNTPKVTGFPGGTTSLPSPLSEEEVKTIMDQIKGESSKPKLKVQFEVGESVRVIEGPFLNFSGVVEEINPDKGKVKVMVSIFGRATPVELEFSQIEKV
ncbi:MAG: transcription termination/antitermination protein NusG [Nitrospinales bacterium]